MFINKLVVIGEYENLIYFIGIRLIKKDKIFNVNSWKECC